MKKDIDFYWKIINVKLSGIKNIENEIKIKFLNETIPSSKKLKLDNKKIKTIYGTNGAGKTAIIRAIDLYKNIASYPGYIAQEKVIRELKSIINIKTKKFSIEIVFAFVNDNKLQHIYKHKIMIYEGVTSSYELEESFYRADDVFKANGSYSLIYSSKNGEIQDGIIDIRNEEKMFLERQKLITSSVSSLFPQLLVYVIDSKLLKIDSKTDVNNFVFEIFTIFGFTHNINVYLDVKDKYQYRNPILDIKDKIKDFEKYEEIISLIQNDTNRYYYTSFEDRVLKKNYSKYKKNTKNIFEFIKIIKPRLKRIDISKKEDGDIYRCRKIFVYDYGSVDLEFESTGIKKMVELYSFIKEAFDGHIVFIDEIDANISGVFLDKLMKCFNTDGKGQICFSSHNFYSMNKLKEFASITTIGETGMIVDIPRNGNSNPANVFYDGDVMDSPFNIIEDDFYSIFVEEEEDSDAK